MQIAIPLYDRFAALDVAGPYEVLAHLPGAELTFVAAEPGLHRTDSGPLEINAPLALDELTAPDVLVVPGGFGTRAAQEDERLLGWIRGAHAGSQWTTSVCTGALLLGAAGVLDGLEATTHWLERPTLTEFGARPVERRVVEQGKVITAAGVSAGIDMALTLVARLADENVAQAIQLGIEYDPEPPFAAGSPSSAPQQIVDLVRSVAA